MFRLTTSVSVELESAEEAGDLAAAAGLVFRLDDRKYYAVIVSKGASGSRKLGVG
jgi:hypothetical protein